MNVLKQMKRIAKSKKTIIALPEANLDERMKMACETILKKKISNIIVFGNKEEFPSIFRNNPMCEIIDIEKSDKLDDFALQLYEMRKAKGLTQEQAKEMVKQPVYFAMMLLKNGIVGGVVAGAKYSTADVLRPGLQIIKTKPDKKVVTGGMLMLKKGSKPLFFADVSLIQQPTSEELAEIAIASADFMKNYVGVEPQVAMLSFSTKGSSKHEMVDKVKQATEIAKSKCEYAIDGEMQADSALDFSTSQKKGITSSVGGNANVLVFPDLNAGNIGTKLVARLGGYEAIGPIMLNFNKPINDLSRGCTVQEIINTVVITKLLSE